MAIEYAERADDSLLAVMQSGEAIETGIVGADGLLGGDAPVNGHLFGQATVQMDGAALTMPKAQFLEAYNAHPHLRNLVNRYQSILLMQAQQNAACHALHSVRSRFCRWMLQSQDMIGSDTFILTQEFLSHMLGVRRNTVSVEAHSVQQAGLIQYRCGHITILQQGRSRRVRLRMLFCHPCGDRQAYGSRLAPNRRRETCHLSVGVVRLFGRPSLKVARHFPQSPSNPKVNRGAGHRNESFSLPTQVCTTDHVETLGKSSIPGKAT